jgi:hypothetical protein
MSPPSSEIDTMHCLYSILLFAGPGANPMTSSYNASVVKIYNATGSLTRFENNIIFFCFEKCCSPLQRWRYSCKF